MAARREPERTCVGCRKRAGKGSLLRLARMPDGAVTFDPDLRSPGRGCWVHPGCAEAAFLGGGVARSLRVGLDASEVARLRKDMEGAE